MNFEFASTSRIIFGAGSVQQAGRLAGEMGKNALPPEATANTGSDALTQLIEFTLAFSPIH